mmetsp:Transcript_76391/g.127302  ORF Transcript_76391/g.127302 Transcript_76391/m.127302 type:complete len:99 (+) Transcript_76391:1345-1641(+)
MCVNLVGNGVAVHGDYQGGGKPCLWVLKAEDAAECVPCNFGLKNGQAESTEVHRRGGAAAELQVPHIEVLMHPPAPLCHCMYCHVPTAEDMCGVLKWA